MTALLLAVFAAIPTHSAAVTRSDLEALRLSGELPAQRRHAWQLMAQMAQSTAGNAAQAAFESWYGEGEVFASAAGELAPGGMRGFARANRPRESATRSDRLAPQPADAPVITYTLYNRAAYAHIRRHRLNDPAELARLRSTGPADSNFAGNRSVPTFPADAVVMKTVWWPVAPDRITPLPVWDPERNPPRRGGNDYTSWQRVVAVDPRSDAPAARIVSVDFAGRRYVDAQRVRVAAFHHFTLDAATADRIMRNPTSRKAALISLGRAARAGDYLLLVGASLATKEISDWVWATFWWHDRPDQGKFAAGRPATLQAGWHNYLMQVAFDSDRPAAVDGGPHVCFNPWLEARFPDGGHGGGTASNCMACHRRASYPRLPFLPVTRGAPDLAADPAFAPGRLRTNFLWSIALQGEDRRSAGRTASARGGRDRQ